MSDKLAKTEKEIKPSEPADYELFCQLRGEGKTLEEISNLMGYAVSTFVLWKNKSDYDDKVLKYRKKYLKEDLLKADKCVRNNLKTDNLKAAELVYKREGELSDNQVNVGVKISLTDFVEAENDKK
jgi:hypothetical protein